MVLCLLINHWAAKPFNPLKFTVFLFRYRTCVHATPVINALPRIQNYLSC